MFPLNPVQNLTNASTELAIQDGFLLVFTALGNTSPDIPAAGATWPTDGVFVSLDSNIITAAGSAAIAALGSPSGSFSEWEFTGNYSVSLGPLSGVSVNGDGSLVSPSLSFSAPLPHRILPSNRRPIEAICLPVVSECDRRRRSVFQHDLAHSQQASKHPLQCIRQWFRRDYTQRWGQQRQPRRCDRRHQ
jgi:hypothetical protein